MGGGGKGPSGTTSEGLAILEAVGGIREGLRPTFVRACIVSLLYSYARVCAAAQMCDGHQIKKGACLNTKGRPARVDAGCPRVCEGGGGQDGRGGCGSATQA